MVCRSGGLGLAYCHGRIVYVSYEIDGDSIVFYFDNVPVSVKYDGNVDIAYEIARKEIGASPYWR